MTTCIIYLSEETRAGNHHETSQHIQKYIQLQRWSIYPLSFAWTSAPCCNKSWTMPVRL